MSELGAVYNVTEWWVERHLKHIQNLPSSLTNSTNPERTIVKAYLWHSHSKELPENVRNLGELADSLMTKPREDIAKRDTISNPVHFVGASLTSSRQAQLGFGNIDDISPANLQIIVPGLLLQAATYRKEALPVDWKAGLRVYAFSQVSLNGGVINSTHYTRATVRESHHVTLHPQNSLESPNQVATVIKYFLFERDAGNGIGNMVLGRYALVQLYAPVSTSSGREQAPLEYFEVQPRDGKVLALIHANRIKEACILHEVDGRFYVVRLWNKQRSFFCR
jgi:hypothetical protein